MRRSHVIVDGIIRSTVVASSSPSLAAKSVRATSDRIVRHCRLTGHQQRPGKHRQQSQSRGHEQTQVTPHYPCWWVCSVSAELAEASPRPEGAWWAAAAIGAIPPSPTITHPAPQRWNHRGRRQPLAVFWMGMRRKGTGGRQAGKAKQAGHFQLDLTFGWRPGAE